MDQKHLTEQAAIPVQFLSRDLIEKSVQRRFALLEEHEDALLAIMSEVARLAHQSFGVDVDRGYARLCELVDQFASYVNSVVVCKKGCHGCCKMAVTICDREAQKIDQYLGIKRVPQKKLDLSVIDLLAYREKTVEQWLGVPCTFLAEDGSCRIYEVRPMACRVFWNLSDYPQLCDCSTKLPVPSVDMGLVHLAAASMTYEEEFGDIREYYPLPKF